MESCANYIDSTVVDYFTPFSHLGHSLRGVTTSQHAEWQILISNIHTLCTLRRSRSCLWLACVQCPWWFYRGASESECPGDNWLVNFGSSITKCRSTKSERLYWLFMDCLEKRRRARSNLEWRMGRPSSIVWFCFEYHDSEQNYPLR